MSAQLFQLLGQLDRPGATELVIATGRQVAVRINAAYQTLTASPVTLPQLMHLIRGTELATMVPQSEQVGDPIAIDLNGRPLRAQFIRQGADVLLRLEHRPAPQAPARPTPVPPAAQRHTPTPTPSSISRSDIAVRHTPTQPPGEASVSFAASSSTAIPTRPAEPSPPPVRTRSASMPSVRIDELAAAVDAQNLREPPDHSRDATRGGVNPAASQIGRAHV